MTRIFSLVLAMLVSTAITLAQDVAAPPPVPTPGQPAAPQPPKPLDPDEEIALVMQGMTIDQIAQFLSEKTGKAVIPHNSIRQMQLTIITTKKLKLSEAMQLIREALKQQGIIIEEYPLMLNLKPIGEVRRTRLRVIDETQSAASIPDKALIVDKVYIAKHYDVLKLKDAVVPMLSDFAHITADPNTSKVVITDSVGNLGRIEEVIAQLDVPAADQTIKKIIPVKEGDASEIVSIVRLILSGVIGKGGKGLSLGTGPASAGGGAAIGGFPPGFSPAMLSGLPPEAMAAMRGQPGGAPASSGAGASSSQVQASDAPIILVPEVSRNWIIAVAPADIMDQIELWVAQLDKPSEAAKAFEVLNVTHVAADTISSQITQVLSTMPQEELRASTRVVPFGQSQRLAVFGSERGRAFVKELLAKLDIADAHAQEMRVFHLKNADAEQVVQNINDLFTKDDNSSMRSRYYYYGDMFGSSSSGANKPKVKATADKVRNSVTVIADTPLLNEIAGLIEEEWDKPLSSERVQPKVYILKHADPVQVKDLLESLFSKKQRGSMYFFDYYEGLQSDATPPAGPLFGQFSFQSMPESNRLVVTSKSAANFAVIDQLIEQLDQPQDAGLPQLVELKHANAEDLSEQINASLAEPGTLAEIIRSKRELSTSERSTIVPQNNQAAQQLQQYQAQQQGNEGTNPNRMTFWWQRARPATDAQEASNLIGKIRVVPIVRRNALMIIAPLGYQQPLKDMIQELDRPGMQVVIHAIITEVEHSDESTLGVRFASNKDLLNDPRLFDQSIGAGATVDLADMFQLGGAEGVFNANVNVSALLQLLIRKFGLKILFEPKLYTSDNQEAEFFDGQDVSIQTASQTSPEGSSLNSTFTYVPIGTRLRVRPHITKDGDVDLVINLELSDLASVGGATQNPTFNRREVTTHIVVHDGQTVMLSGIVRQEQFDDVRKFPLLGDIPLIGGAFRNTDKRKRNRELVAFITPKVLTTDPAEVQKVMDPYQQKLEEIKSEIEKPKPR